MQRVAWLLFVCVVAVGALLAPGIGPSWDEPDNIVSGGQYAQFFGSADPNVLTRRDPKTSVFGHEIYSQEPSLARYPPVPNFVGTVLTMAGQRLGLVHSSHDIIVAFHVATVLFFALLVATVYRFGLLLGLGPWASLVAAGVTLLHPTLFGYGFSNLKDTAQVSLFTVSLYYLVRAASGVLPRAFPQEYPQGDPFLGVPLRESPLRLLLIGSICWGLALASKMNAVYVPIIWGIWGMTNLQINKSANGKRQILFSIWHLSFIITLGCLTAVVVWPYLWFDPIGRAVEVVRYFSTVGTGYKVFWDGVLYQVGVGKVLWWYPWASLFFSTPPVLLVLAGIGAIGVIREIREGKRVRALLFIWLLAPTLRAFLPNAAFYDGLRHFLEILPAAAILVGIGAEELGRLGGFERLGKLGRIAAGVVMFVYLAWTNAVYFPFSTGYYNFLAREPNVRFDRDIEALSVGEGVAYLHKTYGSIRLWSPIGGHLAWYYLGPTDRYVYSAPEADSIILVNKSSHIRQREFDAMIADSYRLDREIRRGSAVFAWVYRRK